MEYETCLLQVKGITKAFPGVKALTEVSFDLRGGEVHALVGENGAGKSTLIKILSGAYQPDEGEIYVQGKRIQKMNTTLASELGIHTIYQENTLVPELSVSENIFLGHEKCNKAAFIDWRALDKAAENILNSLETPLSPRKLALELGIAEQQTVQITKAIAQQGKILIMDEPTASYGREEVLRLFRIIESLKKQGKGIIFISHHLDEVFDIADRITVIRDGMLINTYDKNKVTHDKLIADMVGRNISLFYSKEKVDIGNISLDVKNISKKNVLNNIRFHAREGEILGIYGLVGAGRTELSRVLFGRDRADIFDATLYGQKITCKSPKNAIKNGISLIPEDRRRSGLVIDSSIKENITLAGLHHFKGPFLKQKKENSIAKEYVNELRIRTPSIFKHVMYLSGGNQQKVVFAKWIFTHNKIFILDEPTRGVDIGAKEEIYKIMVELARQGKTIIMITSEMPELLSMCDRVLVMKEGSIVAEISAEEMNEQDILKYSLGGR